MHFRDKTLKTDTKHVFFVPKIQKFNKKASVITMVLKAFE